MRASASERQRRAGRAVMILSAVTLVAPLLVLAGAMGTQAGLWDWRVGHDLMAMRLGLVAAGFGALAAIGAVVAGLADRRRLWSFAVAAVAVSVVTLWGYGGQLQFGQEVASSPDATTNAADPPVFSRDIRAARAAAGAVAPDRWRDRPDACRLGGSIPRQVAPEEAAWALKQAGFRVIGAGVGRADGDRESFWFGFGHDAVVRIRPAQTDVRVLAREDRDDGGEACRRARRVVDYLRERG